MEVFRGIDENFWLKLCLLACLCRVRRFELEWRRMVYVFIVRRVDESEVYVFLLRLDCIWR